MDASVVFSSETTIDQYIQFLLPGFVNGLASVIAQSVIYGVYMISLGVTLHSLVYMCAEILTKKTYRFHSRRRRRLPTIITIMATLIMFGLSTFMWIASIILCIEDLNANPRFLRDEVGSFQTQRRPVVDQINNMRDGAFMVAFLLGDAVLAWRTLVLVNWHRWITISLISTWIIVFALVLTDGVIGARHSMKSGMPEQTVNWVLNTSWCLSLLLDIACIFLLSQIAWSFRKSVAESETAKCSPARRALYTLITIGASYIVFSLPRIFFIIADDGKNRGRPIQSHGIQLLAALGNGIPYQLVCLFPTMVTAVIFYESSIFETHRSTSYASSTLRFAGTENDSEASDGSGTRVPSSA